MKQKYYIVDERTKTVLFIGEMHECELFLPRCLNAGCDAYIVNDAQGYKL